MLSVHVKDEFAPLKVALVHDGTTAIDLSVEEQRRLIPAEELREHPEAGPVFRDRVVEQQAELLKLLAFHGVTLVHPQAQPGAFCQVFTRDPCFAVGQTLYLGSLRDAYRHPEFAGLVAVGQQVSRVACVWGGGALIEGGDVMVLQGGRGAGGCGPPVAGGAFSARPSSRRPRAAGPHGGGPSPGGEPTLAGPDPGGVVVGRAEDEPTAALHGLRGP
jgi:hypothetical protein